MSIFVVDASVAAKWFFEEEFSENALDFLDKRHSLLAPALFFPEMDSLLLKRVRRKEVSVAQARDAREAFRQIQIHLHSLDSLSDGAFEISLNTGTSIYDCFYLSLAVFLQCKVVTADRRFCHAIQNTPYKEYIVWIEDL